MLQKEWSCMLQYICEVFEDMCKNLCFKVNTTFSYNKIVYLVLDLPSFHNIMAINATQFGFY